jgi:hypothetical protein
MTILAWFSLMYVLVGILSSVWVLWPHFAEVSFEEYVISVLIWPVFMLFLAIPLYSRLRERLSALRFPRIHRHL